jgi:hypothetical protein
MGMTGYGETVRNHVVVAMSLIAVLCGMTVDARQVVPQNSLQEGRGAVGGFVTAMNSGEPVAGVTVVLFRASEAAPEVLQPEHEILRLLISQAVSAAATPFAGKSVIARTTTDDKGRFTFRGVPPGNFGIGFAKTGYVTRDGSIPHRTATPIHVTLQPRDEFTNLNVQLSATASISGRVLDSTGEAKPLLKVEAMRVVYRNGMRLLANAASPYSRGSGETDDRGEYRLFGLPPGNYYVRVLQPGMPTSYYPSNTIDPQQAVPVTISPGVDARGIDISLAKDKLHSVSLKLPPIPQGYRATFNISPVMTGLTDGGLSIPECRLQANRTDLRCGSLPPGSYDVLLRHTSSSGQQNASVRLRIDIVDQDLNLGTVALSPDSTFAGKIVIPDSLADGFRPERVRVRLGEQSGAGRKDGTFELANIPKGDYHLEVEGLPPNMYVAAARLDGGDALSGKLDLSTYTTGLLEIFLEGSGGTLGGTVVDSADRPAVSVEVVLVPPPSRRGNPSLFRTATTDHNGAFSFQNVPPAAQYKLLAWDDARSDNQPYSHPATSPEFLRDFEIRAFDVDVRANSRTETKLIVISRP